MISLVKEPPPGMVVDADQAEQNLNMLVNSDKLILYKFISFIILTNKYIQFILVYSFLYHCLYLYI